MNPRVLRLGLGAAVAIGAIAALRLPASERDLIADRLATIEGNLGKWTVFDTLQDRETVSALLLRGGIGNVQQIALLKAAAPALDPRRARSGMAVEFRGDTSGERPTQVMFKLAVDRLLTATLRDGQWTVRDTTLPWIVDTVLVKGTVRTSLYQAVADASAGILRGRASEELAWNVADIYEYRYDMSQDLYEGDEVRALFERRIAPDGTQRIGTVLAAGLKRGSKEVQAVRMEIDGRTRYYDADGRSLATAFLRAPLSFRRISSSFGGRKHPILGTMRQHTGVDYAAAQGTPIRAIGDGTVRFVGPKGGYGNAIEIRHPNGFVTRYGHMRGFASGMRVGTRVSIGETIGYVGMTGLATGPHLHFEVLVNGAYRNPSQALQAGSGPALTGAQKRAFEEVRVAVWPALDQPSGVVRALGN